MSGTDPNDPNRAQPRFGARRADGNNSAPPPTQPQWYNASPPPTPAGSNPYAAQTGPGPQGGGAPVCPRHPDRVSYVRCQRCGRPACTECQRSATVGVHCVDCAREAAKSQRQPRTVFGGRVRQGQPVVTLTIIVICTVIEALRFLAPGLYQSIVTELIFAPAYGLTEPYRFLTSTFLHGGLMHLAFNMYALWLVGGQLERMLGRGRFAALYLLSALGGSVGYLAIAGVDAVGAVGASGGVFGLFAAYAVFIRRLGGDSRQILVLIGINLVLGFVISNIAWQAHIGGMVTGGVVAALFAWIPANATIAGVSGRAWQWIACAAVLAILVATVFGIYALN